MHGSAVDGSAAADLTHLIAELVENATIYSPPDTTVHVRGDRVSNGYSVEVEDRGLGLQPEEYDAYNRVLTEPPEFDLADSDRLGLFVVAKLAQRHAIKVLLRRSPFGGTTAIVFVPDRLVTDQQELPPPRTTGCPRCRAGPGRRPWRWSAARTRACQGGSGRPHCHPGSRTASRPSRSPSGRTNALPTRYATCSPRSSGEPSAPEKKLMRRGRHECADDQHR
ncbi:sensor histidine kinase [Nonomuraea ferruginea]